MMGIVFYRDTDLGMVIECFVIWEKEADSGFLARRGLPRPDGLCISRLEGVNTVLVVEALYWMRLTLYCATA